MSADEINGGHEGVSIKTKILENPNFKELSEDEVFAEIVSWVPFKAFEALNKLFMSSI